MVSNRCKYSCVCVCGVGVGVCVWAVWGWVCRGGVDRNVASSPLKTLHSPLHILLTSFFAPSPPTCQIKAYKNVAVYVSMVCLHFCV